jgi:hypothetical protein
MCYRESLEQVRSGRFPGAGSERPGQLSIKAHPVYLLQGSGLMLLES